MYQAIKNNCQQLCIKTLKIQKKNYERQGCKLISFAVQYAHKLSITLNWGQVTENNNDQDDG